jgi:hypothetical protein
MGLKISYYFKRLVKRHSRYNFYVATSLGCILRKTNWENAYAGTMNTNPGTGPLYIDLHLGAEYRLSKFIGVQLDVSVALFSVFLALHL